MAKIEYEGINQLGRVFQSQMNKTSESPPIIDFGIIQADYSLKTNTFPLPIPKSDYLVCRQLTIGAVDTKLTQTQKDTGQHPHGDGVHSGAHTGHTPTSPTEGEHTHPATEGKHIHPVLIPEKMRSIKPGDRVLVAWVGNDAVVVDIILNAEGAI